MNIPARGYRESGENGTAVPVKWKPATGAPIMLPCVLRKYIIIIRRDLIELNKPKIWNIAILSLVVVVLLSFLTTREHIAIPAVILVICGYLAVVIVFLLRALVGQLQYNPYSYNTIYYTGFALFLLSVLIAQIAAGFQVRQLQLTDEQALRNMFFDLLNSAKTYMLLSAPFLTLFSVGLCLSNLSLIRHEGKRPVNLLGILLSVLMLGGILFLFFSDRYATGSMLEVMRHDILVNLFAALYLYYECMLIGTMIANLIVVRHEPAKDQDYLIVLGCGLRPDGTPTPLLAGRINRALAFYRAQIEETGRVPTIITSGGQGLNEIISESASMKAYLMERGVPEEHILEEDRSASTYENMQFSGEIIRRQNPNARVVFSTTNYHVFRSGLMARRVKLQAEGIGAKTRWYFGPNAAVREFVALLTEHRLKQGLILGGTILIYCIGTVLLYLG